MLQTTGRKEKQRKKELSDIPVNKIIFQDAEITKQRRIKSIQQKITPIIVL